MRRAVYSPVHSMFYLGQQGVRMVGKGSAADSDVETDWQHAT